MSSVKRSRVNRNLIKPMVLAVALALPGAAAMAASMDDVVTTRNDQNIDQQYGRDSVYAFAPEAKPLMPAQQGSHSNPLAFVGTAVGGVWHATTGFIGGVWHKTTGLFDHHGKSYAADQSYRTASNEPTPFGRAGGYIGSDRVEALSVVPAANNTAASDTVKTGQDWGNAADTRDRQAGAGYDAQRNGQTSMNQSGTNSSSNSQSSFAAKPDNGNATPSDQSAAAQSNRYPEDAKLNGGTANSQNQPSWQQSNGVEQSNAPANSPDMSNSSAQQSQMQSNGQQSLDQRSAGMGAAGTTADQGMSQYQGTAASDQGTNQDQGTTVIERTVIVPVPVPVPDNSSASSEQQDQSAAQQQGRTADGLGGPPENPSAQQHNGMSNDQSAQSPSDQQGTQTQ